MSATTATGSVALSTQPSMKDAGQLQPGVCPGEEGMGTISTRCPYKALTDKEDTSRIKL